MTGPFGGFRAADLGIQTLASVVNEARAAVLVLGDARRVRYANVSAGKLFGFVGDEWRQHDILDRIAPLDRADVASRLDPHSTDVSPVFSTSVRGREGQYRDVAASTMTIADGGSEWVVLTLWDVSRPHAAARTGAVLVQGTAQQTRGSSKLLLDRIAHHAVESTRAVGCEIAVVDENDRFLDVGWSVGNESHSPAPTTHRWGWTARPDRSAGEIVEAMTGGTVVLGDPPGRPIVVADARQTWRRDFDFPDDVLDFARLEWNSAVVVPLAWKRRVIGLCTLYLPSAVVAVYDAEIAFVTALADHAALAVMNARLTAEATAVAGLAERARLARELHDSVSQALFSISMHARAANLAMSKTGAPDQLPLQSSLSELTSLARRALAEMRALIFELRPDALAEDGLVAALHVQATAITAREGLPITVTSPGRRILLPAPVEETAHRIAVDALNWVVEHGRATEAKVQLEAGARQVSMTIAVDGAAFGAAALALRRDVFAAMAAWSREVGAELSFDDDELGWSALTFIHRV